ncbi:MAG TPA: 4-hydroxy-tetrahydrodipicolinate synthase [Verrucomicrobiae bacterium]|jgi:4-hydroxy-tetrahydrodipicolinate synthase|nr:4-hydroxy-tetrahydrodipicolinate synthase [Verrucomicrobiae bacterium]
MFIGTYTAIVTPFKDGKIDDAAFERLIALQVKGGVDGIVPAGTTGESSTLGYQENIDVVARAVKFARGKIKIIAGTGANSTAEATYLTRAAEEAGADASLQVAPYYNRPTQEGLYQHFKTIAGVTSLPIVLYNIPSRCGVEIAVDTVKRLKQSCKNIVAIKESGGNCDRVSQLRAALGPEFVILSGDDSLTLPFMAVGAQGVISVASNVIPREISQMVKLFRAGKSAAALRIHEKYFPLVKDLFIETNPIPVKAALAMMKLVSEEYRLPLVPMNPDNRNALRLTLKRCGVLK